MFNSFSKFFTCLFALVFCFLLTACGFEPVYKIDKKTGAMQPTILQDITIDPITGREGQILKNELEYLFGYNAGNNTSKNLRVSYTFRTGNFGLADVTNVNKVDTLVVDATFSLYDKKTGRLLDSFSITRSSSNVVSSASGFAQNEAQKRKLEFIMQSIAEAARNRLLVSGVPTKKSAPN